LPALKRGIFISGIADNRTCLRITTSLEARLPRSNVPNRVTETFSPFFTVRVTTDANFSMKASLPFYYMKFHLQEHQINSLFVMGLPFFLPLQTIIIQ